MKYNPAYRKVLRALPLIIISTVMDVFISVILGYSVFAYLIDSDYEIGSEKIMAVVIGVIVYFYLAFRYKITNYIKGHTTNE